MNAPSRSRLTPYVELMKIFMKRRSYRRPASPMLDTPEPETVNTNTHDLPPAPDNSTENNASTYEQKPASVAERMARPATHPSADPNTAGSHAAKTEDQKKK